MREKGTKNKTGLIEAYADKDTRGFAWNNLMLQRWTDHNGEEHRVLDDYERNVTLVDLTAQPTEISDYVDDIITEHAVAKNKQMVGAHFMKSPWQMGYATYCRKCNTICRFITEKLSGGNKWSLY